MPAGIIRGMIMPVTTGEKSRRLTLRPRSQTQAASVHQQTATDSSPSRMARWP